MSGPIYHCGDENRRSQVASSTAPANLTGIDYVEVLQGPPLKLIIHLVKPVSLAAGAITDQTVRLTGGERLPPPRGTAAADPSLAACSNIVVTFTDSETDFSTYTITLVRGADDPRPPDFIDPRLASVDFSFKVDCQSDFDCAADCPPPSPPAGGPIFDYTAPDYQGLRRLMLDRVTALVPNFDEAVPADFTVTLIEALAFDADQASYRLDWVATEAFIGTARSRTSLRRHARLVDYQIGEGASARVFVRVDFTPGVGDGAEGMTLNAGTPFLPRDTALPPMLGPVEYRAALNGSPIVFESMKETRLWSWRNAIKFYTWKDDRCILCKGATAATLVDASAGTGSLGSGDLLLLEETVSPETGLAADAARDHRQVVRLTRVTPAVDPLDLTVALIDVEWDAADALRFDLAIQITRPGAPMSAPATGAAIARANIVLAEHGASLPPFDALGLNTAETEALRPRLVPRTPPDSGRWLPRIDLPGTLALPPARVTPAPAADAPASWQTAIDPAQALPALTLVDDFETWTTRSDLLSSSPFSRDFVVEVGIDRRPMLRFGDNLNGLPPAPGAQLGISGRFGCGTVANLGPDALAHVVLPLAQKTAQIRVTNPLPATGGADLESAANIRARAPEAFRRQDRAVTAADYALRAKSLPDVADAIAVPRWTGAWWTMLVYVDRVGGVPVDAQFEAVIASGLERYRMMGFDVAVFPARSAPLDIELEVCALPSELRSSVAERVRRALSPFAGGATAFFHPNRFGFETALYFSRLVAAVMAVQGVQSLRGIRFQRWARAARGELAAGVIRPVGPEILRLDDDPSRPELGRLAIRMGGGR